MPDGPIAPGTYETTAGFALTFDDETWVNLAPAEHREGGPRPAPDLVALTNRDVPGRLEFHEPHGVIPPGQSLPPALEAFVADLELPDDLAGWVAEHPSLTVTETTEAEDGSTVFVLETTEESLQFLCFENGCPAIFAGEVVKLRVGSRDGVPFAIFIVSAPDTYEAFAARADAVVATLAPLQP